MPMSSTAGAIDRPLTASNVSAVQRQLFGAILLALLVLVVRLAALLLVRRLSGAFLQPLSGPAIVVVAAVFALATFVLRRIDWPGSYFTSTIPRWSQAIPRFAAFGVLVSLSVPGTSAS